MWTKQAKNDNILIKKQNTGAFKPPYRDPNDVQSFQSKAISIITLKSKEEKKGYHEETNFSAPPACVTVFLLIGPDNRLDN
jgi:hypothetical protein